ncbi:hypothetical protein GXB81_22735 [Paraburkholderia sp. Ac-20336]|uniref:hypothetical protein n=1 Tax=unclassified Paraburkholderia TaxID=2615204 RepID=UPI001423FCE8|nr:MULTISPECIES: hypothetical protein [unclassified Paraburkholderia]MBN3805844.1 hypothetical protein [Paraburkholderia sp. Ac-20336]MBN3846423.1 hypothetical protein [Paraburkholderia sp. Ac-20342]NIF78674.1 hypothetical protein [Paraburkholderia sp. Cy-641]
MNNQLTRLSERHHGSTGHAPMLHRRLAATAHRFVRWLRLRTGGARSALQFSRSSRFVLPGVSLVRASAQMTRHGRRS